MADLNRRFLLKKKLLILLIIRRRLRNHQKQEKRFWVRPFLLARTQKGLYNTLVNELFLFDHEYFFHNFRMTPSLFEKLVRLVAPYIIKSSAIRETCSPGERLAVTLRYLATWDSQRTIGTSYRISPSTMGRIIRETSQTLWVVLSKFIKAPKTPREWIQIAEDFDAKWNFPHCIGAIDGKHINIQAPANSGSMYFNYKKFFSIVLLAVCNANYEFTLIDVGDVGRQSDSGVYNNSNLGHAIDNNTLGRPSPEPISGYNSTKFPYTFVGDEAFSLKTYMMRPYPRAKELNLKQTIYNYRLSRARRIIENSFGIPASRFRIFHKPIIGKVENIKCITKATIALHNFLIKFQSSKNNTHPYLTEKDVDSRRRLGSWRGIIQNDTGLTSITNQGSNNYSARSSTTRDEFANYFVSPQGKVSWQDELCNRTSN